MKSWHTYPRRIVRLLLALLTIGAVARAEERSADAMPSPAQLEAEGAIIGTIYVDAQNIFDVNDPAEDKTIYRGANALHVTTREGVIRQQLLFRTGEPYSQRKIEESER